MICPSDLRPVCPESCPPIIHLVEWQRKLSHRSLPRLSSFFVCKMTARFWMFWKQFAVLWGIYMVILNFNLVFFKNYRSNSHIFFLSFFSYQSSVVWANGIILMASVSIVDVQIDVRSVRGSFHVQYIGARDFAFHSTVLAFDWQVEPGGIRTECLVKDTKIKINKLIN